MWFGGAEGEEIGNKACYPEVKIDGGIKRRDQKKKKIR